MTKHYDCSVCFSQVDYQCVDFVPRHHNIIRFRRGVVFAKNDFNTVCSWVQFPNDAAWKYDIMISKNIHLVETGE